MPDGGLFEKIGYMRSYPCKRSVFQASQVSLDTIKQSVLGK